MLWQSKVTIRCTHKAIQPQSIDLVSFGIPYFLEISPHLELSPPSKSRRVVLTLNALNAALEFSPHMVKDRQYYCVHKRNVGARICILTLILNNAQFARRVL